MASYFKFPYQGQTVDFDDYYARAISVNKQLWTFGKNSVGQLGDNTITNRSSPVQTISGGTDWTQVAAGYRFMGGLKSDSSLWCWGLNTNGQLGDNTITHRSSPVQTVAFGTNWSQISCGNAHAAALKKDSTLWCWGLNTYGNLGNNTITHRSSPIQTIAFGTNWSQVSCGTGHTAAIKADGTLWTWGLNDYGQLGDNTITHRSSPVQTIAGGNNWSQVSCGGNHTGCIKTDGTLWLWGLNDIGLIQSGQLGDNTTIHKSSPVQTIAGGTNWSRIICGERSTSAIKTDGTLWTWGANTDGQLGDNTVVPKSSPIQTVAFGTNWFKGAVGNFHMAFIKTDGTLWTWGNNAYGQLGNNAILRISSPIQTIAYGTYWNQTACGTDSFTTTLKSYEFFV